MMEMRDLRSIIVAVLLARSSLTGASPFELIAGYEPTTQVTDPNAIDLDQDVVRLELEKARESYFSTAEAFYTQGGYSGSYADLQLQDYPGVASFISAGTKVVGTSRAGNSVDGIIMDDLEVGETNVRVLYATSDIQTKWSSCRVGALPVTGYQKTSGCFQSEGILVIDQKGSYRYSYDVLTGNKNDRTLQKLSTGAEDEMLLCPHCPHRTFQKFFNYYGVPDYGDRWIMAAFKGTKTRYARGNADFSRYRSRGRAEAVVVGAPFLNVWMYVIRKMEEAIDLCSDANGSDYLNPWDQAVAFFTGSLEGQNGTGAGMLVHALADQRCTEFKTCGESANEVQGRAAITNKIFRHFDLGKESLIQADCKVAAESKIVIEDAMVVPLVQSTIRYAVIREQQQDSETTQAQGATFAASVLPLLHYCNAGDADIIYNNMKVGSGTPIVSDVKKAFERNYQCMGISCADIGGFYDSAKNDYYKDAYPCQLHGQNGIAIGLGIFFGLVVLILIAIRFRCASKKRKQDIPYASENIYPSNNNAWT